MGRIVLLRHGRTLANAAKYIDTRPPGAELSMIGREQARQVGEQLAKDFDFAGVSSSVAIRAQQTAVGVAETYERARGLAPGSLPISVVQGLHEIDAGELEGRGDDAAHLSYRAALFGWLDRDSSARMPGGETAAEVVARYLPTLEDAAELVQESGRDYLIVGHGAAIRIATLFSTTVDSNVARGIYVANCDTMVIEPAGEFGQWLCHSWAGTAF